MKSKYIINLYIKLIKELYITFINYKFLLNIRDKLLLLIMYLKVIINKIKILYKKA